MTLKAAARRRGRGLEGENVPGGWKMFEVRICGVSEVTWSAWVDVGAWGSGSSGVLVVWFGPIGFVLLVRTATATLFFFFSNQL